MRLSRPRARSLPHTHTHFIVCVYIRMYVHTHTHTHTHMHARTHTHTHTHTHSHTHREREREREREIKKTQKTKGEEGYNLLFYFFRREQTCPRRSWRTWRLRTSTPSATPWRKQSLLLLRRKRCVRKRTRRHRSWNSGCARYKKKQIKIKINKNKDPRANKHTKPRLSHWNSCCTRCKFWKV